MSEIWGRSSDIPAPETLPAFELLVRNGQVNFEPLSPEDYPEEKVDCYQLATQITRLGHVVSAADNAFLSITERQSFVRYPGNYIEGAGRRAVQSLPWEAESHQAADFRFTGQQHATRWVQEDYTLMALSALWKADQLACFRQRIAGTHSPDSDQIDLTLPNITAMELIEIMLHDLAHQPKERRPDLHKTDIKLILAGLTQAERDGDPKVIQPLNEVAIKYYNRKASWWWEQIHHFNKATGQPDRRTEEVRDMSRTYRISRHR